MSGISEIMKKIAIVAGEVSGDILGSRLITSLKKRIPDLEFEGVGGEEMKQAGCKCLYPMERLSVMGFAEVLSRLFELLKIRKSLIKRWKKNPPDLVIGIDAPDFNLVLEKKLHQAGIPTIHYVSPSIWAWRENRVKKMVGNIDLMLTLFPFEVDFYKKYNINAAFVGHPLADEIPLESNQKAARESLGLSMSGKVLAILPGSRSSEVKRLTPEFLLAVTELCKKYPELQLVAPMVNRKIRTLFKSIKKEVGSESLITLIDGQSRKVMEAADVILMASGTAVLEGMLIGRPMVAAYKISPLTMKIIRFFNMFKVDSFTLPNNLSGEKLVPELMQEDMTVKNIVSEVGKLLEEGNDSYRQQRFLEMHKLLRKNASDAAAEAIISFLSQGSLLSRDVSKK